MQKPEFRLLRGKAAPKRVNDEMVYGPRGGLLSTTRDSKCFQDWGKPLPHLELDFYDHHFGPGAYLQTHADHMARWHLERSEG